MGGDGRSFLLVTSSGVLHMDPAHEECNLDAVPRSQRRRFEVPEAARAQKPYRRDCQHCFPKTVANPEPATATSAAPSAPPSPPEPAPPEPPPPDDPDVLGA